MTEEKEDRVSAERGRLASRPSAGIAIGGFLAGLEHAITNRPPVVAQIEEPLRGRRDASGDVVLDGLDAPIERREAPDRSRARL